VTGSQIKKCLLTPRENLRKVSKKIISFYRISGQDFFSPYLLPELAFLEIKNAPRRNPDVTSLSIPSLTLSRSTIGWVGGKQREVETWSASPGLILKVAGGSDFYIAPDGMAIVRVDDGGSRLPSTLSELDNHILLGPVLVLALALRGTWCLHASAALYKNNLIVMLGESGRGKSTLAAYLAATPDWRLVADDILPVTMIPDGVIAWPRFPQLKLPLESQPGASLPERLTISKVCVLTHPGKDEKTGPQLLPAGQAVQEYLGHTAGVRLFEPELLERHLAFCAHAAGTVPVYRLPYTHRKDVLPRIKEQLESLC
jgi:hypothetical protein